MGTKKDMTPDKRSTIKLPVEVYEKLKDLAAKNHRTIAGQIASMLQQVSSALSAESTTTQN